MDLVDGNHGSVPGTVTEYFMDGFPCGKHQRSSRMPGKDRCDRIFSLHCALDIFSFTLSVMGMAMA